MCLARNGEMTPSARNDVKPCSPDERSEIRGGVGVVPDIASLIRATGSLKLDQELRMRPIFVALPHNIPDSSSSAFLINSSLTTTVGRGTRKNIADAHAIESAKIAAVNGSVVVEWPPR